MFGIGAEELVVIFVIALFVLGPERLPSLARDLGKAMRELRRASDELTEQFMNADQVRPEPPASAPSLPEPAPQATVEPATATAEAPVDDTKTEFDRKAQEEADQARERGEIAPSAPGNPPPSEPERWG